MISTAKLAGSALAALAFFLLTYHPSHAQTLVTHRLPATLAMEAVGEAVSVCTGHKIRDRLK
jgi:hypothetical protein